jgi:hypothetical protein
MFKDIKGVDAYFCLGWTNENVPWRPLWPLFDGWFLHGGLDTTNHVKRHWEIKYTILGGKFNHSIWIFIIVVVESIQDGIWVGSIFY